MKQFFYNVFTNLRFMFAICRNFFSIVLNWILFPENNQILNIAIT